jgi:hypothetical protein
LPVPSPVPSRIAALAVPGAAIISAEARVVANAALGALLRAKSPKRRSISSRTLARARDRRLRTAASLSPSRSATCCERWPSR